MRKVQLNKALDAVEVEFSNKKETHFAVEGGVISSSEALETWTPDQLREIRIYSFKVDEHPAFDTSTHKLSQKAGEVINGEWIIGWDVVPLSAEELSAVALSEFEATNKDMVQISEDLLDLLIAKGIFTEGELPSATQTALTNRRTKRANLT